MIKIKKKIILLSFTLFILSLLFIAGGSFLYIENEINKPRDGSDGEEREFAVQKGESVKEIAGNLEKENLINGKTFFEIYVWQKKIGNKLQAGSYKISPSMTIPEMASLFIEGKIISNEIWIVIPEGFSNEDIDRELSESGLTQKEEFINFNKNPDLDLSQYDFLRDKPQTSGLQGYYFPDTYKYYKNSSPKDIAAKMLDNFGRKLFGNLKEEIKKQNRSVYEIITLASIVEKEAGNAEDMPKIAGVFKNRLDAGKPLESDATINFITGSGRSQATLEDLKTDSPYNTYKYSGLPPGPIANPGIEAIKAAVYPEKTDYFYFLTKKDKKAVFSKTYEEHLKNKEKYLK